MGPQDALKLLLGGDMNEIEQERMWTNFEPERLLKAWKRKIEGFTPEPGSIVKFYPHAVENLAICLGAAPVVVEGDGPSYPFWGEPHGCLLGFMNAENREFSLASWPKWALESVDDGHAADRLRELAKTYRDPISASLRPGDLCRWKEGMKNRRQDGIFLMLETFEPRLVLEGGEKERLPRYCQADRVVNCKILIDRGGTVVAYAIDRNRLMPA
jgi:hypothetical protein